MPDPTERSRPDDSPLTDTPSIDASTGVRPGEREDDPAAASPRPRRSFWVLVSALVLVFVVYPLSYGPVMYQVSMGRWIPIWPVLDLLYTPIDWFANSSRLGEDVVDWYLGVWGA